VKRLMLNSRLFGILCAMLAWWGFSTLDTVDFRTDEDAGQLSMFGNECEGICGV
jgi:hypothetical protein